MISSLTLLMLLALFSVSVWSSCSDESVSSRDCSSSSEGSRALRYGIELGFAAITECKQAEALLYFHTYDKHNTNDNPLI